MPPEGKTPSPDSREADQSLRIVRLDQPFQPFAPGFVEETTDWEGNNQLETTVRLVLGEHPQLKNLPPLPFHLVLVEGGEAEAYHAGPPAAHALTPLGTEGYQVTPEDYNPAQRIQKLQQWQGRGNVPYEQGALWLRAVIPEEELERLKLLQETGGTPLSPDIANQLRQLELTLDFGTDEPLAGRPDLTTLQISGPPDPVDIHSFYPKRTGPLSVPTEQHGMQPASADIPASWLQEGLGVYLPKDPQAYQRAQMTFSVVPEKQSSQ